MHLEQQRILIFGLTPGSIGIAIGQRAWGEGALVDFTYFPDPKRDLHQTFLRLPVERGGYTEEEKKFLADERVTLRTCDVTNDESLVGVFQGNPYAYSGLVYSVAYADPKTLLGETVFHPEATREGVEKALSTSASSFLFTLRAAKEHLKRRCELHDGASILALTFDPERYFAMYGWMTPAKAALESMVRAAAFELGREAGIRVNALSSGPLQTLSAKAIPGFKEKVDEVWNERAPLGWNTTDDRWAVADTALYLLGPWSRKMSGQTVRVDGGFSSVSVPLPPVLTEDQIRDQTERRESGPA